MLSSSFATGTRAFSTARAALSAACAAWIVALPTVLLRWTALHETRVDGSCGREHRRAELQPHSGIRLLDPRYHGFSFSALRGVFGFDALDELASWRRALSRNHASATVWLGHRAGCAFRELE